MDSYKNSAVLRHDNKKVSETAGNGHREEKQEVCFQSGDDCGHAPAGELVTKLCVNDMQVKPTCRKGLHTKRK